jgi:hypothetical protein
MIISSSSKEDLSWWINIEPFTASRIRDDTYEITIYTDASLVGWGCVSSGVSSHGGWTSQERQLHINALELLAIERGLRIYCKCLSNTSILLQIDNKTAIAFINRFGGCHSSVLNGIAKRICQWCEARKLVLFTSYISSKDNAEADYWSRTEADDSDWKLSVQIFQNIYTHFGKPDIDLFASHLTSQCERYVSWLPDPNFEAIDAFTLSWSGLICYAFPPFALIPRVLRKIRQDKCRCI